MINHQQVDQDHNLQRTSEPVHCCGCWCDVFLGLRGACHLTKAQQTLLQEAVQSSSSRLDLCSPISRPLVMRTAFTCDHSSTRFCLSLVDREPVQSQTCWLQTILCCVSDLEHQTDDKADSRTFRGSSGQVWRRTQPPLHISGGKVTSAALYRCRCRDVRCYVLLSVAGL